jgi:hypothetical protein
MLRAFVRWMALLLGVGMVHASAPAGTLHWDRGTLTLVAKGGNYGRMIRLADGRVLCAFGRASKICISLSADDGRTWTAPRVVATCAHGKAANAEPLQLANGWVLVCYNERPVDGKHPFAICIAASRDGCRTWRAHARVYEAGLKWENGCWEPAALQLPSGEVQLFFANEGPYRQSREQEISLVRSADNGLTWCAPRRVAFRSGYRDGMPVPLLLAGGKGIVIAIEDNQRGRKLQPSIIFTSVEDNWGQPFAGADSPRRWRANVPPLPPQVYAGAPYLRQFPSGETVLSCQSDEGRREPVMVVYLGDADARNFRGPTVPFPTDAGKAGKWNALFVKNATTVTAISNTTIKGVTGLWAIDGRRVTGRER